MPCAFSIEIPPHFEALSPHCQFRVPERELIEFDGALWCKFHLPMSSRDGSPSQKSGWDANTISQFNDSIFARVRESIDQKQVIDLQGVVFPSDISFVSGIAGNFPEAGIFLAESEFHGAIDFSGKHFGGIADFLDVKFKRAAYFGHSHFDAACFFNRCEFGEITIFSNCRFEKLVKFSSAVFDHAIFNRAIFAFGASFENANFHERAEFSESTFRFYLHFEGARFRDVFFNTSISESNPEKSGRKKPRDFDALPRTYFQDVMFGGVADFSGRIFSTQTTFARTTFDIAPNFHGCKFHPDIDFDGAYFRDTDSVGAARAYRTLKLAMEEHRSRDDEGRFYALEMKSRRKLKDTPISVKIFSWLYEISSDYGRSFLLPVLCLFGSAIVFSLLYLAIDNPNPIEWKDVANVARFTLRQIVRPFADLAYTGVFGQNTRVTVPLGLALLAALQSVISVGFVAITLVALRRRFRMA